MRSLGFLQGLRLFVCVLGALLVAAGARAGSAGLPAVISVGGSGLDAARIQAAIEHELGVALVIAPNADERLEVAITGRRANVTYYAPGHEPVTRSVDLPRDEERALETIAFLAGNLARDEAAELLKQLAPAAPEEPPPPPPPAAPTPSPAPKAPAPKPAPPAPLAEPERFTADVSLYYPLTALKHTESRRLNLEIGLVSSRVGAIHGAGGAFGYFRSDGPVEGFSVGIGWNRSGPVRGMQFGGFVNEGYGELRGLSFAGLVDARDGDTRGAQGALIVTSTHLAFGIQASPIVAVAHDVVGVQAGGVVAVSRTVRGVQAGVVSVAGPTEGLELGIVNVAGRVKGLQLGLVNVAGDVDGGAIGFVSIAKNGRLQPSVWFAGPGANLMVGLRSVVGYTYSELAAGYDPGLDRPSYQVTAGLHLDLGHRLYGEVGGGYGESYEGANGPLFSDKALVRSEVRYEARAGFEPVHGVTAFAGGGLTQRIHGTGSEIRGTYFFGVSFL
ncbi:MAG TPA: hypothetical protein VMI54_21330 [Polyangiaceae bacterium]|nr:hypothetical protein [Polyangiaceae bacterium]